MIKPTKLFRSGKRYRGFVQGKEGATPVTFNVYTVDDKTIKVKYLFPNRLAREIGKGSVIFALIEDKDYMVAELRILKEEKGYFLASLDFVTKDRRRLPRICVEGMDIKAEIECGDRSFKGRVLDLSMTSIAVSLQNTLEGVMCQLTLVYKGRKFKLSARALKSYNHKVVFTIEGGEFTSFVSRVYSDLLLSLQRT